MQRTAREAGLQPYALVTIAQDSVMFTWTYTKDVAESGDAEVRRGEQTKFWHSSCSEAEWPRQGRIPCGENQTAISER